MKWYKHITDSLDDPFIFELMEKHGSAGYVAFFGILEIYAREFKVADDWKLVVRLSYLKKKLRFYHKKILINCLKTIGSQPEIDQRLTKDRTEIDQRLTKDRTEIDQRLTKDQKRLIKDSGKWEIEFYEDRVSIFIPKFRELMDESTLKKFRAIEQSFRNCSGIIPKSGATDVDVDVDVDKERKEVLHTSCSEPEKPLDSEQPVLKISLVKKDGDFLIFQKDIEQWKDTFPAVNILQTLKEIRQWNLDNSTKRKTKSGIRRHISFWMGKEQNKGGNKKNESEDILSRLKRKEKELNNET